MSGLASAGISDRRATRRRGAPVSGSMPATQGINPLRSRASRSRRSFGIFGSASAALKACPTAASIEPAIPRS